MAKKNKKKNGKRKIPIISTALILIGIKELWNAYKEGGTGRVFIALTGYDQNYGWNWKWARAGIPLIGAGIAEAVIRKSGIRKGINIPWFTI